MESGEGPILCRIDFMEIYLLSDNSLPPAENSWLCHLYLSETINLLLSASLIYSDSFGPQDTV